MELSNTTWRGSEIDDWELLASLPANLQALLEPLNGFIIAHGALHVRGACQEPAWHSLKEAMQGEYALHTLYDEVQPTDIPFAQDQCGDQFILRDAAVFRLDGETGELSAFAESLKAFLEEVVSDIEGYLNVGLEHVLEPGQLLHAYPPFCVKQSEACIRLRAIPAHEVIAFHVDLARQIRTLPDGAEIRLQ
jgi:hypothetical protein